MRKFKTADLYDEFSDQVRVAEPVFRSYGSAAGFYGPAATVKVFEDNVLVRRLLERPGNGRVLVVDGGGSLRCALVGDRLAALAIRNGWAGLIINGCIRDVADIAGMAIGIRALAANPRKSAKAGTGETGVEVRFAGVSFRPGEYVFADADGILVAKRNLLEPV